MNVDHTDHIVVVDPAARVAELACFNKTARLAPLPCTYHLPALFGPETLQEEKAPHVKGIIVFGSGTHVSEAPAWQTALAEWLRPLMDGGVPTLGICYGHQLISHMYGGEVGPVPGGRKHVGFRRVDLSKEGPFDAGSGELCVSHQQTVLTPPKNFRVFAVSSEIPTDGLCHTDLPIWTFQSHPEATTDFLRNQEIPVPTDVSILDYGWTIVQSFLQQST